MLTQVWLKSIKKGVSYLTKKLMHKKRVLKNFQGLCTLTSSQKVCDENESSIETKKEKNDIHTKMLLMEGSAL